MLNTYQLRKKRLAGIFNNNEYFCTCSICEEKIENKYWPSALTIIVSIILGTLLILMAGCTHAYASVSPEQWESLKEYHRINNNYDKAVILSIIGEAEGESQTGKNAIACVIHNRGSLTGVYGLNSYRVKNRLYSKNTYKNAVYAWKSAQDEEYCQALIGNSTGWGNDNDIEIFKTKRWWKNCIIVKHIGHHWFYEEKT